MYGVCHSRVDGVCETEVPVIIGGSCAPKRRQSAEPGRRALSDADCGTTPPELPFEGGDPIAKRSVFGLLIAQSLGEV
jgi:hypothetical protein